MWIATLKKLFFRVCLDQLILSVNDINRSFFTVVGKAGNSKRINKYNRLDKGLNYKGINIEIVLLIVNVKLIV